MVNCYVCDEAVDIDKIGSHVRGHPELERYAAHQKHMAVIRKNNKLEFEVAEPEKVEAAPEKEESANPVEESAPEKPKFDSASIASL